MRGVGLFVLGLFLLAGVQSVSAVLTARPVDRLSHISASAVTDESSQNTDILRIQVSNGQSVWLNGNMVIKDVRNGDSDYKRSSGAICLYSISNINGTMDIHTDFWLEGGIEVACPHATDNEDGTVTFTAQGSSSEAWNWILFLDVFPNAEALLPTTTTTTTTTSTTTTTTT